LKKKLQKGGKNQEKNNKKSHIRGLSWKKNPKD
jgi:hypothetical protein